MSFLQGAKHLTYRLALDDLVAEMLDRQTGSLKLLRVVPVIPHDQLPKIPQRFLLGGNKACFAFEKALQDAPVAQPHRRRQQNNLIGCFEATEHPLIVDALDEPRLPLQNLRQALLSLFLSGPDAIVVSAMIPKEVIQVEDRHAVNR